LPVPAEETGLAIAAPLTANAVEPVPVFPEPGRPFPALSEITPTRLAANRENAQKSCGPKTETGKSISSQNRTTHGLARHNGRFALLPTEDPTEFAQLLNDFTEEHQPATPTEMSLVHTMAESLWLRNRAQNLQITCFHPTTGDVVNEKSLSLFLRYENTYNRAFNSSLNQLLRVRSEKRKAELGFEAQQRRQQAELRTQEKHQMKKDAHYWDILKKDGEACHQISKNALLEMDAMERNPDFPAQFEAELQKRNVKSGRFNVAVAA
jgi:hypothetical protein